MITILLLLFFLGVRAAAPAFADTILITEVVTDPQQDHSESAGGNGVRYDLFPGTGTVSSVDEYIELYNASFDPIDLTGYVLWINDTSPTSYVFGTTKSGVTRYSPGSSLKKLLAGGFVLLGNPPGAINNKVTVAVHDSLGNELNSVVIEDGKAGNVGSEAVARIWDGSQFLRRFFADRITPLGVSNPAPDPVPEPSAVLLLAVTGAVAAAVATRRRARRESADKLRESPPPRSCRV